MADNNLEFVFNFTNKVTGEQQVKRLTVTTEELTRGYNRSAASLGRLNALQRKYVDSVLATASAQLKAGKTVTGGSVNAFFGPGSQKLSGSFKTSTSSMSSGAFAAKQVVEMERQEKIAETLRIRQQKAAEAKRFMQIEHAKRISGAKLTTVGFGGMLLAHQAARVLDPISFMGAIAPNIQKVTQGIGSLFGTMLGQVFSELGGAIGTAVETVISTIITAFATGLKAVTGFFSGMFLSFIGLGLTGGIGLVIGAITGLFTGLIAVVSGIFEIITGIVKGAISIIASVISAGLTIVKSIFTSIGGVITGFWEGFWEGLKNTAQAAWDVVQSLTKEGLDQLSKGFQDLVESERLAAKAYIQVTDVGENKTKGFISGVGDIRKEMDKLSTTFGISSKASGDVLYKMLSGGFRDVGDAVSVANAAMKLNLIVQGDAATSADGLRGSIQAWGASADQATDYASQLSAAIKLGSFNADEYNTALANVSGSAAAAGMSLREVNAVITTTSLKNLTASRITIGLNKTIKDLQKSWDNKSAKKALSGLGIDTTNFEKGKVSLNDILNIAGKMEQKDLFKIFKSEQSQRLMQFIMNDIEGVKNKFKELGGASSEFEKDVENMKGMWFNIWDVIKEIGAAIRRDLVVPFQKELYPVFESISAALSNMFKEVDFKNVFGGLATALGPLFRDMGKYVTEMINSLTIFLKSGGLNKMFSGENFKLIVEVFRIIFRYIVNMPSVLEQSLGVFSSINSVAGNLFDNIIMPALNYISDPSTWASMIIGLSKAAAIVEFIWSSLKIAFSEEGFGVAATTFFTLMSDVIESIGFYLKNVFLEVFRIVSLFIGATIGPILKKIAYEFVSIITEGIGKALKSVGDAASGSLENLNDKADRKLAYSMALQSERLKDPAGYGGWSESRKASIENKARSRIDEFLPQAKGKGVMEAFDIPRAMALEGIRDLFGGLGLGALKTSNNYSDRARNVDVSVEEKRNAEELERAIKELPRFFKTLNETSKGHFSGDFSKFAGTLAELNPNAGNTLNEKLNFISSEENRNNIIDQLSKGFAPLMQTIKDNTNAIKGGGIGRTIMRDVGIGGEAGMAQLMSEKYPGALLQSETPYTAANGQERLRMLYEIPGNISDPMKGAGEANSATGKATSVKDVSVKDETVAKNTTSMMNHLKDIREDNRKFYRGVLQRKSRSSAPILVGGRGDEVGDDIWND